MKNAESLVTVERISFTNEKTLVAFLYPKMKISKVTHT